MMSTPSHITPIIRLLHLWHNILHSGCIVVLLISVSRSRHHLLHHRHIGFLLSSESRARIQIFSVNFCLSRENAFV